MSGHSESSTMMREKLRCVIHTPTYPRNLTDIIQRDRNRITIFRCGLPKIDRLQGRCKVLKGEAPLATRPLPSPLTPDAFEPLRHIVYMTNANTLITHVGPAHNLSWILFPVLYIKARPQLRPSVQAHPPQLITPSSTLLHTASGPLPSPTLPIHLHISLGMLVTLSSPNSNDENHNGALKKVLFCNFLFLSTSK